MAPHDALVILLVLLPGAAGYAQQPNPGQMPLHERGYLYLLAANLGTSIIPWALLYQPSASVDKGLGVRHMRAARIETLAGVLLCQTISSVLPIASAATLGDYGALDSVARIETAFTATLGMVAGRVVFVLGLSGSALVATIVVCLTLAWTIGEVLGVRHSLEQHPRQAPWFYGSMTTMLVAGRAVVASGVDLVDLSIAAGVLNALLLPLVLSFLFCLARVALPEPWRLRSGYAAAVAVCFACIGGVCLYTGIAGMF